MRILLLVFLLAFTACQQQAPPSADAIDEAEIKEGELLEKSLVVDDSLRSYLLYVPGSYNGEEKWPLIINYHGFTQSAGVLSELVKMNEIADTAHFLVAYPQGLLIDNPVFQQVAPGWNLGGGKGLLSQNDDLKFSKDMIEQISSEFSIDDNRIHLAGFSMGGHMAIEVACTNSEWVASFAAVGASMDNLIFEACNPEGAISFLQINGTHDSITPFNGIELENVPVFGNLILASASSVAGYWAESNACTANAIETQLPDIVETDSTNVTKIEYRECGEGSVVRMYRLNEGGHVWPGGELPESMGRSNNDINASAEIIRFFAEHARKSTTS